MSQLFKVIHKIEEWLLAWAMIAMAVLTILNVIARVTFNYSLAFAEELTGFLIIIVCFVGLSYAASEGRHIRMTAFYDMLPVKPRRALMIVIAAVTSLLMFYLAYWSVGYISVVRELDSVSPTLRVPLYIVYLSAPLGLVLAGIQYALTVVRNLRERGDIVYMSYGHSDAYAEPETTAAEPDEAAAAESGEPKGQGHI
ncbi:MAG: TRAP transporter small permease [Phycisphaeraceae bacterium]